MTSMTTARFDNGDRRLVLVALLVMALALLYTRRDFWAAFPQASIDLKYSKEQITAKAREFLVSRGLDPRNRRNLTLFDDTPLARYYLERELGTAEANRLMSGPVSVWRWRARWFRPPEQEEFVVWLSPDARLVGFDHVLPESAPGERLTKESARAEAERFLKQVTGAPHRLIEEKLIERPNRLDYEFTWELDGFRAKDATYRREVVVRGGSVASYREFLYVPEQWERDFQAQRSRNALFQTLAESLYVPLGIAAIATILHFVRRRDLRWRPLLAIAGVVGVLNIGNEYNNLPFFLDRMPTSSPLPQSILLGLLQGLGAGVGVFFYVILAAAAGEPLYRRVFPRFLSLRHAFTWRGVRTREFFRATVAGYAFAAAHIAFVVAFYVYGQKVGVWSPQDIAYSDLLSTAAPWIAPLAISLLAASAEEFWFRLFAVPLLARVLPRWAAIAIPAFVWGFLHSNYPQQPGYIRGIEVGIIGVAAGYLMYRFGILATLIWHYTVDAVLIGMFLFQSGSLYFQLSGVVVSGAVLLPLLASLAFYRRHGGFRAQDDLVNSAVEQSVEREEEPPREMEPARAPAWPLRRLYYVGAAAAVGALFLHPPQFGDFVQVRISKHEAKRAADQELRRRGLDPASYRTSTSFSANLDVQEFEYLRRSVGPEAANRAVQQWRITGVWRTRYFRPLEKEEWRVFCDPEGRVYRVDHLLDEKAPGARLDPEAARRMAEGYLQASQGMDPARLRVVDQKEEKREQRTDHSFVWEDGQRNIGEARARLSLSVIGDEVAEFRRFWKLPEDWVREFEKPRLRKVFIPGMIGAMLVPVLWIFLRRVGSGSHRHQWRLYGWTAGLVAAVGVAAAWNDWSQALASYDTATPLAGYLLQRGLIEGLQAVLLASLALLGVMAFDVYRQAVEGPCRMPSVGMPGAAAVALFVAGGMAVLQWLSLLPPGPRLTLPLWNVPGVDTSAPAVELLYRAASAAVLAVCAAGVLGFFLARYLRPPYRWALIGLGILAWAAGQSQTWLQGAAYAMVAAFVVGAGWLVYATVGANFAVLAVGLFWARLAGEAWQMASQPAPYLKWNAAGALATALLSGWLILRLRAR
jgi:membrane protease YdiL (CAAX protease family)